MFGVAVTVCKKQFIPIEPINIQKRQLDMEDMENELSQDELDSILADLNDLSDEEIEYLGDEEIDDTEVEDEVDEDELLASEEEDYL